MASEARKITAHYLNGLAVAILATTGGAAFAGSATIAVAVLAVLISLIVHLSAVWFVRSG